MTVEDVLDYRSQHATITTDPATIAKFIRSKGRRVIFCTYRSAPILIDVIASTKQIIDFAVFDEAHHIAGSYEKQATALLNDNQIQIRKRLFMTATPRILVDIQDAIVFAGMDDATLFGEVAYTLSFREALDLNILVDYQVIAAVVTEEDLESIDITESRREKIVLAAISKSIQSCELKRGLTFHTSIADATRFSHLLRELLSKDTYVNTLNSSHSQNHRAQVLSNVKSSEHSILTNVRILGEGFDFSALDYIVFVDPKNSPVDIVQNIGRIMRKHEEKDIGTIVLPILIENISGSEGYQIESSRYSPIFRIASALGSIDGVFSALLGTSSHRNPQNDNTVRLFMNSHIKVIGINSSDRVLIQSLEEKIRLYIVAGSGRGFRRNEMLKKLNAFCQTHNRLPSRLKPEELLLFNFVSSFYTPEVSPELKAILKPIIDTYRTQKIDRNLPIEDQFKIFESWVRENRRFPYNGPGGSKQSIKELFEDNSMTMTDEEQYMRQWIYNRAPKKLTPDLKEKLANLRQWVTEVSPTTSQLVKQHNLGYGASALKEKLISLGVDPFFSLPIKGSKILWDMTKVRNALNLPNM